MPNKSQGKADPTARKLPDDLITVSELAEYLRFSAGTVRRMARERTIPSLKVGSEFRFRLADVMAKIQEGDTAAPVSSPAPMAATGLGTPPATTTGGF